MRHALHAGDVGPATLHLDNRLYSPPCRGRTGPRRSGRGRAESLRAAARRERQARAEAARAERRRLARLGTATQVRDLAHYAAAVARASVEEAAAGRTAAETERDQALEASHRLRREVD